jgi:hypothetical protein
MSELKKASIKNLARKGPPPYSFVLGDPQPWGIVEPEIELVDDEEVSHAS